MNITTIGLDLAKSDFHVVCYNGQFKEVKKRMLRRKQVLQFFTQLAPCLIGMEACASANYWGRELRSMGHDVKLIPPQHVKRYLRGNKNDYNDARAIAEAATRPDMPTVAVKTTEEQDIQALLRMRSRCLRDRTALCNSTRGLLSEYGIILPKGITALRRSIPDLLEDADNALSDLVIIPFLTGLKSRAQAAMASFCFGVIPPFAIFGRSLLYVQSQRVA